MGGTSWHGHCSGQALAQASARLGRQPARRARVRAHARHRGRDAQARRGLAQQRHQLVSVFWLLCQPFIRALDHLACAPLKCSVRVTLLSCHISIYNQQHLGLLCMLGWLSASHSCMCCTTRRTRHVLGTCEQRSELSRLKSLFASSVRHPPPQKQMQTSAGRQTHVLMPCMSFTGMDNRLKEGLIRAGAARPLRRVVGR